MVAILSHSLTNLILLVHREHMWHKTPLVISQFSLRCSIGPNGTWILAICCTCSDSGGGI